MNAIDNIDLARVPRHVAIIMDGNGRWARRQGKDRSVGHKAGVDALHTTLEAAKAIGIKYLTVYTFSTENWNRPKQEVDTLMNLIVWGVERETPGMIRNGVRLQVVGDLGRLPDFARERMQKCIDDTAGGRDITLIIALSYSSRWELTEAARRLARDVEAGRLAPDDIDETTFAHALATSEWPDPDLLIRTGGELRISNYLLWQIAYSELYFCDTYWPDFDEAALQEAIESYQRRQRRFGKTEEQVESEEK